MASSYRTLRELDILEGEPTAIIRVRNLQTTIQGPSDAWGRPGRPQPALVSAEVSLKKPFGSSSSSDAVAKDTVHYGLLSKAVLATLDKLARQQASGAAVTLMSAVQELFTDLTGLDINGFASGDGDFGPFLDTDVVRRLTVTFTLPKASLLGSGVAVTGSVLYGNGVIEARGGSLNLVGLRVPTLIGVNDNERLAKQITVANIGIEHYSRAEDYFTEIEAEVVDVSISSPRSVHEHIADRRQDNVQVLVRDTGGSGIGPFAKNHAVSRT